MTHQPVSNSVRLVVKLAIGVAALTAIALAIVAASGSSRPVGRLAPIGVVSAAGVEQAPILAAMDVTSTEHIDGYTFYVGSIKGRPVVDVFGGEMDEAAELASYLLISHFHPRALLFSGTAGAQAPWINVGDVVLSGYVVDKSNIHYWLGGYQTPYAGVEVPAGRGADLRGAVVSGYDNPLPTPTDARYFGQGPTRPNTSWVYATAFAGARQLAQIAARTTNLGSTLLSDVTGTSKSGSVQNKVIVGVVGQAPVWTEPLPWIAAQDFLYQSDAEENEGTGFAFAAAKEGVPWLLIRGISDTPWFPNAYDGVVASDHAAKAAIYVVEHVPSRVSTQPVGFADLSPTSNARRDGYLMASEVYFNVRPVTKVVYKAPDGTSHTLTGSTLRQLEQEYTYGAANP